MAATSSVNGGSKLSENPLERMREPHGLSMPIDAVETECGHLYSEADLRALISSSTKTNAAGARVIPCSICRRDIAEGSYRPNVAVRRMNEILAKAGVDDPDYVSVPKHGEGDVHAKLDNLTSLVIGLAGQIGSMKGSIEDLKLMCGVQSLRLDNVLGMTVVDMGRTCLPYCLGGISMTDIANRRLSEGHLAHLNRMTEVIQYESKKVLDPIPERT